MKRDLVDSAQHRLRDAYKSAARFVPGCCLVEVSEAWSTQTCERCGFLTKIFGSRIFTCAHCDFTRARDPHGCANIFTLTILIALERLIKGQVPFGAPTPNYAGGFDGGKNQRADAADLLVNTTLATLAMDEQVAINAAVAAITEAAQLDAADPGFAAATTVRKEAGQALHFAAAGRASADLWFRGTRNVKVNAYFNKALHRIVTLAEAVGTHAALARGLRVAPGAAGVAAGAGAVAGPAAPGDVDMALPDAAATMGASAVSL